MSNFRLKDPDCVLIHIPKTGGTSIRKGVWERRTSKPAFGHIPAEWAHLYKFAFVRHPLDRMISAWKMFTEGAKGDKGWKLPDDARPLTMEQFLDIVEDDTIIYDERRSTVEEKIRHHAIPQTHPFNCLQHADFVGRFERLDEDFNVVATHVGIAADLPKMHYTDHEQWQKYLSGRNLERAVHYYREDIAVLGYTI